MHHDRISMVQKGAVPLGQGHALKQHLALQGMDTVDDYLKYIHACLVFVWRLMIQINGHTIVPIILLLFIINSAHPAIGSAIDVLGLVRKHTRYGFGGVYPRLNHLWLRNSRTNPETTKHAKQSDVHKTDVNMCVRQMRTI